MPYKVLTANFSNELEKKVNEHIHDGWTPLGGVSVCAATVEDENSFRPELTTDYMFAQAMTHDD